MIDAYKLENSSAIYPRIIISDKLIERLNYPIDKKCDIYPYHQYLSRFEDGYVGFSQLIFFQVVQSCLSLNKEQIKTELGKSRKTIIDGLNCSAERSDVFVKFKWLKDQYEKLVILESGLKECIKPIMENAIHYPM